MDKTKNKRQYKYEQALADALSFTEDDLAANEQGQITERQAKLIRSKFLWQIAARGLISAAVLLFSVIFFSFINSSATVTYGGVRTSPVSTALPLMFGIFGLFVLIGGGAVIYSVQSVLADSRLRRAEAVEGIVTLDIQEKRRSTGKRSYTATEYVVSLGDQRFPVGKDAFLAFKNGDPYIMYYAPNTKTLLSADWLRDDPFNEEA